MEEASRKIWEWGASRCAEVADPATPRSGARATGQPWHLKMQEGVGAGWGVGV